jgi:hypothetical protein
MGFADLASYMHKQSSHWKTARTIRGSIKCAVIASRIDLGFQIA